MSLPDNSSTSTAISSFNISTSQSQHANLSTPHSRALQQPNNNNNSRSSLFVRRLIVTIVLLFVIIKVVNFIAWSILHPLPPVFELNSFNISISPPNSPLNTDYDIVFTIRNPNKKLSLLLDHFEILVFQGKTKVSSEQMPTGQSVYLKKNPMDFPVHGKVLKLKSFLREVTFNVQVNFRTKFLASNWFSKRELMAVYCSDLNVRSLSAKRKGECSIHV
ncbi:hypothetical protein CRYUN_Cryun02cG0164200 [Craigia yunnanensis]